MALIADIADAVKDALNGHTFSLAFDAVRSYRPQKKRENLQALTVWVVPRSRKLARVTRGSNSNEPVIDVGIQRAVDPDDLEAMDELIGLSEEIGDFLLNEKLAAIPAAHCMGVDNDPMAAPEQLIEDRVFLGVLSATYRLTS